MIEKKYLHSQLKSFIDFFLIDPDMEVRMKNTCPSKFLPFFPVNRNQVVLQIIWYIFLIENFSLFQKLLIEIKH